MINIWQLHTQQNPEGYEPIPLPIGAGDVSEVVYCPFCRDAYIQVDVTGLTGSQSVSGQVEGSLDNVGWDNLAVDGNPTTILANGTGLIRQPGALPPYIRVTGFAAANTALQFTIPTMV